MYVLTDENGRITATAEKKEYLSSDAFEFEFPNDFDFSTIGEYIVENGKLKESRSNDSIQAEIENLKAELANTDWIISKINEYSLQGQDISSLLSKYADIIEKRNDWRSKINELEGILDG